MSQAPAVGDANHMSEARTLTPAIAEVRVRDCMHHGVFTCDPDDSLKHVAAIMADQRVHAVVITTPNGQRPVGVVSDLDVVSAAARGADCTAIQAAATETVTVVAEQPVRDAAQRMSEHSVSHVIVVDAVEGYPLGVLSTLDVAAVYAER